MSRHLINEYRADLDRLRSVSGSRRESVLREAFKDLLKRWGRTNDLQFIPEHDIITPQRNRIYLDGALLHALRVPFGYWEAKDADDNLDAEIAAKTRKGYPRDNIIYSDDHTAVLIQDGREIDRVSMNDTNALYDLLARFFSHERQEIADFNRAVRQFAQDLPAVLDALRDLIAKKRVSSPSFATAELAFLKHAQKAINPAIIESDVQEMLIQHILTEDIFAKVFDNPDFHRQNNVASELYKLEEKLFARGEKTTLLRALSPYYSGIAQTAAVIQSHSEKQGFLKGLYENFYKVYNEKAADRLGVVYTPGEIVRFMIRSADWLCESRFDKNLIDRGVEMIDPATGTGTFIVELLEHFRGNREKLHRKYTEELHANEVAILPYYVANLNIEATYQAITDEYSEFENLCFVDTLDNVDALGIHAGHQFDLLGALTDENIERIKRQNRRKISVIIGNPPYNANQQNENDNNKNRTYAHIDKRIKDTYIKSSTAHKTKLYDMYVRFYRWASDRLDDDGIIAFITNRSFLDARMADGFRKILYQDFNEIWVFDLGGDVRVNPKLSGTKHNVFGIQTGVAICFLVRRKNMSGCTIRYLRRPEDETAEDKLSWLGSADIRTLSMTTIKPNSKMDWLDQREDGIWGSLIQTASKKLSGAADEKNQPTIFEMSSTGFVSARDDWAFSRRKEDLEKKISFYISVYQKTLSDLPIVLDKKIDDYLDYQIKWTEDLRKYVVRRKSISYNDDLVRLSLYRPFSKRWHYFSNDLNWSLYKIPDIFPIGAENRAITTMGDSSGKPYFALAIDAAPDLNFVSPASGGTMTFARYFYTKSGDRVDNITDWALRKFLKQYGKRGVTKDTIFYYVYAVLHDPIYRETYALNLKREFPRIPFYANFAKWATWGETLMAMHIGYEDVEPWPISRVETPSKRAVGTHPKPILKSQPEEGVIVIDADTRITDIPPEAWSYHLGSRSAIDWVLDQHKEKTPRDPTIAAKFNTFAFADYKEGMITLLARIIRVSVETLVITSEMAALDRSSVAVP